jgi:hypothetical protein
MALKKGPIILIVVAAVFLVLVVLIRLGSGGGVAEGTVLSITVAGSIPEEASEQIFGSDEVVFRELLGAVERARQDDAIAGISFEVQSGLNFAQAQELRGKLAEFVASGKFCTAYLELATNLSYYLASACPEIYLTPTSNVFITGLMGSQTFYRGLFDKLDIYPDMYHIAEYKSARNIYTEKGFTRPHREMILSLLTGWQDQIASPKAAAWKRRRCGGSCGVDPIWPRKPSKTAWSTNCSTTTSTWTACRRRHRQAHYKPSMLRDMPEAPRPLAPPGWPLCMPRAPSSPAKARTIFWPGA